MNHDEFNKCMANGDMLGAANSLTVDDLIRMMPEIEAKWPKKKMPPNPADVHPATFAALQNVCLPDDVSKLIGIPLDAITLHVRTDVEPWKLHPCTCKDGVVSQH